MVVHERLPDWEIRLTQYLCANTNTKYQLGKFDCLLFVADAIKAQTGKDLGRGHRGKYRTAEGADAYLASIGFNSPAAMLDSLLPRKTRAFAGRGDIVLNREGVPGVVIGGEALFVGEVGFERVPRADWRKAWAV